MTSTLTATGDVVATPSGLDLVLTRTYRAPIADVWASVTEPERTARWFGAWRGDPGPGRTIQVQMAFEEAAPWFDAVIDACSAPTHLALSVVEEHGPPWRLELELSEADGATTLRLIDHRPTREGVGDYGCGWEWYLDALTASREGTERPDFDDYHPALKEPYDAMATRASGPTPAA